MQRPDQLSAVDVQDWHASKSSTPDEALAWTDSLYNHHCECDHNQRLGDAVETRREKLKRCARYPERFESTRCVVHDDIDASERLYEHEGKADAHSVSHAFLEQFLNLLLMVHFVRASLFHLNPELIRLITDIPMICWKTSQVTDDLLCLFKVVTSGKSTW